MHVTLRDVRHDVGTDHGTRVVQFAFTGQAQFDEHVDEVDQLSLVSDGVMTARSSGLHWVVPSTRALWIPAGTPHTVGVTKKAVLYCLYVPRAVTRRLSPALAGEATRLVEATPLVHGLVEHLASRPLDRQGVHDARAVLFRALDVVSSDGVELPMPVSRHARTVAETLVTFPGDPRGLLDWSRRLSVSSKTLQRAFFAETGLTFTEWRIQVRLHRSLQLLADGLPVARVARECGYEDASSYTRAFRRRFGVGPRASFDERRVR